jgi:hypothetical protein
MGQGNAVPEGHRLPTRWRPRLDPVSDAPCDDRGAGWGSSIMTTFDGADPVQFNLRPGDDLNAARGVVLGVLIGIAGWGLVIVAILAVVRGHL